MMKKNVVPSPPSPVCIFLQEPQTYFDLLTKVHNFEVELYEKVCLYTHGRILKNVVIEERQKIDYKHMNGNIGNGKTVSSSDLFLHIL